MLLELMELRYGTASTVFCTQFKKKDWHPRLGGGVPDAIIIQDRAQRGLGRHGRGQHAAAPRIDR